MGELFEDLVMKNNTIIKNVIKKGNLSEKEEAMIAGILCIDEKVDVYIRDGILKIKPYGYDEDWDYYFTLYDRIRWIKNIDNKLVIEKAINEIDYKKGL